jgi:hypothetical protein
MIVKRIVNAGELTKTDIQISVHCIWRVVGVNCGFDCRKYPFYWLRYVDFHLTVAYSVTQNQQQNVLKLFSFESNRMLSTCFRTSCPAGNQVLLDRGPSSCYSHIACIDSTCFRISYPAGNQVLLDRCHSSCYSEGPRSSRTWLPAGHEVLKHVDSIQAMWE